MNDADAILITKYLRNELTEKEKANFLSRLTSDFNLQQQLKLEQQLFETLGTDTWSFMEGSTSKEVDEYTHIFESNAIKKLQKTLEEENKKYQKSKKNKLLRWLPYVAAVFIISFFMFHFLAVKKDTQELYATYLKKSELPSITIRGNQSELAKAQAYFEQKDYKNALLIFEKEMNNSPNIRGSIYVYTGITQMELNQLDKAKKTFDTLIKSNLLDAQKGKWFKALLYLKMDDTHKATKILNEITNNKLYNYNKAVDLLKEL